VWLPSGQIGLPIAPGKHQPCFLFNLVSFAISSSVVGPALEVFVSQGRYKVWRYFCHNEGKESSDRGRALLNNLAHMQQFPTVAASSRNPVSL
jgi:hypothetical protein